MADVNITKVYLYNVPLDNGYNHTLYFNSQTEQRTYFQNLSSKGFTDFSYQRKESVMRIPLQFDEALKYNYVAYQNSAYSNKWFYAFITDYEFKGDDQTNIKIETDVLQTWMFDYTVKPSFVEREHVIDDTIGLHTVPENLEVGEYYCKKVQKDENLLNVSVVISATTDGLDNDIIPGRYNGIYSGVIYNSYDRTSEGYKALNDRIQMYSKNGLLDSITSIFLYPRNLLLRSTSVSNVLISDAPNSYQILIPKSDAFSFTYSENNKQYETTKPKNNKLLTYPYIYLLASNNNGGSAIYQYEHFKDDSMYFNVKGCLTPGGSIRITPQKYKGVENNEEEGLNLGKFPICNWTGDSFTNWMTQNAVNIGISTVSGLFQVVAGVGAIAGTGGIGAVLGAGTIAGGITSIAGTLGEVHKASLTPPQAQGNINCGDVVTASGTNTFWFYHMSIKPEYMSIIDEYFSMYGYKTNRVKVPNKNHRENWWFTKTIDVNISGNIPIKDKDKIKQSYNNGITFWKNAENFKNYNVSNNIV